ncbi:MAG: glycosyltransferase family 2 protein [Bacteroidales bacterium]|nr:glycosyltransferase family 2 protein [Bacteroidales bacterium]MBN2757800.1 glycosyltransferase family 2 protein [Bacteroidales bacterium]
MNEKNVIQKNRKVAIITPNFNRAKYISETAESVLQQTYDNWEWIIVDDGSTDNSIEIIKGFIEKDQRVKLLLRDREPKGACTCRNIGVDNCSGDYLIFLDTDDLLETFCVEQRLNAITDDLDFAIFPSVMFRHKKFDLNTWWNIDKLEISELERQFNHDAICQGTGPLFKKQAFIEMGKWNEHLSIWQDIDLFFNAYIRDFKYKKFFNLPPDLNIRLYESSISRSGYYRPDKIESRVAVIKNAHNLLISNNKQEYLKNLKYMAYEVVSGSFASKNFTIGNQYLKWLKEVKLFSNFELISIKIIKNIYKLRLSRFYFSKLFLKMINKRYGKESTISVIKYKDL